MILFEDIIPMLGLIKKIFNQCKCKAIYIFDLVNDKVKTRLIIPIVIMFFVFIIVSSIFSGANSAKPYPTTFSVLIDPPIFMEIGTASRTFVVKVLDQNRSPMQEIEIELQIEDIVMDRPERDFNCDYFYLFSNYWNIKFMRNLGPCSIVILGNKIKTDYTGLGYFENFQFTSGPEGNYFVSFQVANHELSSSSYHILLSPTVYSIQMLNESPKIAYLDKPLNPQPNLIIKNKFDEPVTGKIVYAVSWPFPDYLQFIPPLFNPDGDKYAYLENSKSNPSDYEGRITFSNLTIVGSTHQTVYLRFVAEGIEISCPWKKLKFPIYRNYFSINIYIDPIIIVYKENNTIEQILSEELTIEEGKEFVNQPIFRILDSKQSPVTGIMCFALIRRFNRMNFPVGFYPTEYQAYPKSIFKMASGIYNDSKNISLHSFHSLVTDSSGIVEFQGMGISQGGTNYNQITDIGILFICGTAHTKLKILNITTTVAQIEFHSLPSFFVMDNGFVFEPSQYSSYTIRILDKNGNPIVNKQVNQFILKNVENGSRIDAKIAHFKYIQAYYYGTYNLSMHSNFFGLIQSNLYLYRVSYLFGNFLFGLTIDGIEVFSNESLFLIFTNRDSKICNSLVHLTDNLKYDFKDNETLNFGLAVNNYFGELYENNRNLSFTLFEKSFIKALFYTNSDLSSLEFKFNTSNFLFNLKFNTSILFFENFSLYKYFSGSYYGYFALYSDFFLLDVMDKEINSCINPNPIVFNYINSVSKVLIMNQTNDSVIIIKDLEHLLIYLGICIKNNNEEFLKNFGINAESYIYDYPPVYSYDLYQNYQTLSQVLNIKANSTSTNEFGCLSIIVNPNLDYLGDLVFGILINGISSYPIKLKYEFTIYSIEISESPDNKINYVIFESMKKPFKLKLNGAKNSINHVPVIAFFHGNGLSTHIDIFDEELSYVNFNSFRVNYSDSEGIVTFSNLTVLSYDNYTNADCFIGFFYFKLATNLSAQSSNSVNYTFCRPNIKLYVEEKFSNPIYAFNYFKQPIVLHLIEDDNLLVMNSKKYIIFILKFVKLDDQFVDSTVSTFLTFYLFSFLNCNFKDKKEYSIIPSCEISENSENNINTFHHFYIKFSYLFFSGFLSLKRFDLVICIYNYCNYSSQSLSGIKLSKYALDFEFLSDFPPIIKIDNYIYMKIHSSDPHQSPLYEVIHCNILSFESLLINNSTISNIIFLIGNNINEPDLFNSISQSKTGVRLNDTFTNSLVDYVGNVRMNFQFLSGVSGYYSIECQSEMGYKFFSNLFFLENDIKNITILNDKEYTYIIKFIETLDSIQPLNVTLDFTSEIKIFNFKIFNQASFSEDLEIKIYDSKYFLYLSNLDRSSKELYSQLQSFWYVLTEGPSALNPSNRGFIANVQFFLEEITNNTTLIKNISFEAPSPEIYRIKYFCKGIQSNFSKPIIIRNIKYENFFEFFLYYRSYFFVPLMILIIIFNSIHFSNWSLMASMILIIIEIIIYAITEKNYFTLILSETLLLFGCFALGIQMLDLLKNKNESNFSQIKLNNNTFYTQNLYMKMIHTHLLKNEFNRRILNETFQSKISISNQSNFKFISNPIYKSKVQSHNIIFSYGKNTFLAYIKLILNSIKFFNSVECFYYPQRFIMSLGASFFVLIYCVFQVTTFTFSFISTLSYIKNLVASTVFSFINNLFHTMEAKLNYLPTNYDVTNYYQLILQLLSIFTDLENSVKIALIVSNIVVCLIFVGSMLFLLVKFRNKVLKYRKSQKFICKTGKVFSISSAGDFTGFMIGNTALSYIIITFILTLFLGSISNKFFWELVWDNRSALLILFLPSIIQMIIEFLIKKLIYGDNYTIKLSCFIQIYDIYCLISSMIQGIVSSFTRIIYGLVSLFIGLFRFDKSIIPKWLIIPLINDDVAESFNSLIYLHSCYTNPIFCLVTNLLIEQHRSLFKKNSPVLWVSYILKKFPQIKEKRKNKFIIHSRKVT